VDQEDLLDEAQEASDKAEIDEVNEEIVVEEDLGQIFEMFELSTNDIRLGQHALTKVCACVHSDFSY
jgi:hypothetical protein